MLTSNDRTDPKKFLGNAEKPLDKSVNPCYNTNTKNRKEIKVMRTKIYGHDKEDPSVEMHIEFFDDGKQLLYLTGTKPFFRTGLTIEEAQEILTDAGFTCEIQEVE